MPPNHCVGISNLYVRIPAARCAPSQNVFLYSSMSSSECIQPSTVAVKKALKSSCCCSAFLCETVKYSCWYSMVYSVHATWRWLLRRYSRIPAKDTRQIRERPLKLPHYIATRCREKGRAKRGWRVTPTESIKRMFAPLLRCIDPTSARLRAYERALLINK